MTRTPNLCLTKGCGRVALTHTEVRTKVHRQAVTGMCSLHTIGWLIRCGQVGHQLAYTSDPTVVAEWLAGARASKTLRVGQLVARDVLIHELAEVVGVSISTVSTLALGKVTSIHRTTSAKFTPWVTGVDTTPDVPTPHGMKLGKEYQAQGLKYAPLGTVIVDNHLRAWQRRGKADVPLWCPAHWQDTTTPPTLSKGPNYPAQVVYLPPRVIRNNRK